MAVSLIAMLAIKYGLKDAIHWPWYTVIGCGVTVVVALLANAVMGGTSSILSQKKME
jgi:hypothetical protein